ncbi:MAG TPA: polysaccharide deacetylase family protein [Candidatus Sulfotelmatobacter sp.]|nr:polysaccharide deacetylase family protein [Candidatus Sulfotelmatobacter sp.]
MPRPLPALTYHHVAERGGDRLTVDLPGFEAQVRYLTEHGYATLHAADFVRCLRGEAPAPERAVLLTFDDGYVDTWAYAYPILRRYKAKATLFLVTGWVSDAPRVRHTLEDAWAGAPAATLPPAPPHDAARAELARRGPASPLALTWDEVAAMERSGVVDVQSHTHTHPLCRVGHEINEARLRDELRRSRDLIEKRLGTRCRFLCWPRGWFNEAAVRIAREEGYEACFSTLPGANGAGTDLGALRRIDVKHGGARWLAARLYIYTRPTLAAWYLRLRGQGHHVPEASHRA